MQEYRKLEFKPIDTVPILGYFSFRNRNQGRGEHGFYIPARLGVAVYHFAPLYIGLVYLSEKFS